MSQRYWAFISYSHADARWANRLHRQLEGFAIPRQFVGGPTPAGPAPKAFRPIFKDLDELGASSDLSERLRTALEQSAWLIVICSPAAVRSRWVNEEIRQFRALRGEARILAVIAEGEPFASDEPGLAHLECLPEALRQPLEAADARAAPRLEPAAADLRPGKGGARLALLKVVSGMLGIDLGQLVQRDTRRRNRQLVALAGASLGAAAVFGALAITALKARDEAIAQRSQAEGLIEFMIGDLRKTLEPAGRLDALDAVGARALGYYAAQQNHGLDAQSLGRRARVLHLLGEIRDRRGDLDAALRLFEEAAKSTGELLARAPKDPQRIYDHAQSLYWVGYIAQRRGHGDEALREYQDYARLADQLVAIDPHNADWRAEVAYANLDIGATLLDQGRADEAAAVLQRSLAIAREVARQAPASRDRQFDLGENYAWLATADYHRGRLDAALADRMAERQLYERLIEATPSDEAAVLALAINRYSVGQILLTKGLNAPGISALQAARADLDRLMAIAPRDTQYKDRAVSALLLLGQALLRSGDADGAKAVALQAHETAELLVRKDPTVTDWQGPRLGGARILLIEIAAVRAAAPAAQRAALEPAAAEARRLAALPGSGAQNLAGAEVAAEAALLAGDYASLAGNPDEAKSRWTASLSLLGRAGVANLPQGDRGRTLLHQVEQRLRSLRPPTGLVSPRAGASTAGLVNYGW